MLGVTLVTLTCKIIPAMDQTRLQCDFGANPFSCYRDISYTNNKPQTDGAKNRTFRSSLRAVTINKHSVFVYQVFFFHLFQIRLDPRKQNLGLTGQVFRRQMLFSLLHKQHHSIEGKNTKTTTAECCKQFNTTILQNDFDLTLKCNKSLNHF